MMKWKIAHVIEAADRWCHTHLRNGHSPRLLCSAADTCYGVGPGDRKEKDRATWLDRILYRWLYEKK